MGKLKGVGLIVCLAVVVPVFGQSYRAELEDLLSQSPFIMELTRANEKFGKDLVGHANLFESKQEVVFKTIRQKTFKAICNFNVETQTLLIFMITGLMLLTLKI